MFCLSGLDTRPAQAQGCGQPPQGHFTVQSCRALQLNRFGNEQGSAEASSHCKSLDGSQLPVCPKLLQLYFGFELYGDLEVTGDPVNFRAPSLQFAGN